MQQYKGYAIQYTDYSFIVRSSNGKYLRSFVSEQEARAAIDDGDFDQIDESVKIDWIKAFDNYCKNIANKEYFNDRLHTTNEQLLKNYIKSFEKANNVEVHYSYICIDEQYYYYVDAIY